MVLPMNELSVSDVSRLHYSLAHLTGKPAVLKTVEDAASSSLSEPVQKIDSLLPRVVTEFGVVSFEHSSGEGIGIG